MRGADFGQESESKNQSPMNMNQQQNHHGANGSTSNNFSNRANASVQQNGNNLSNIISNLNDIFQKNVENIKLQIGNIKPQDGPAGGNGNGDQNMQAADQSGMNQQMNGQQLPAIDFEI